MADRDVDKEVVIVGGGPAGLAAAIALRQRGIGCLVVEARLPAIDKGCGEGLMPGALAALRELGILIAENDGHRFNGIRFVNRTYELDACFPNGIGVGVRRTRLHQFISNRARAAGVEILWGTRATLPNRAADRHSIEIDGQRVRFRWLVGADGQASRLRKWAGLEKVRKEGLRFGFCRHYQIAPWSEYVEVHWGPLGQVYVTPVAPDSVSIAFVTSKPRAAKEDDFLDFFPVIGRRLRGAQEMSPRRGAISASRKLRRVTDGRVALIGDASGSVDAITGEGLALSFRQAIALAEAIEKNDLKHYKRAHHKIGQLPHLMSDLMLTMDRWPWIERRAMSAFATQPAFFDQLLSVHVGAESLSRFALHHGPSFGWSLLRERSFGR